MAILDGIKNGIGKVVKKLVDKRQSIKQEQDDIELLDFWKKQLESDRRIKKPFDEWFDTWQTIYEGGRGFDNLSDNQIIRDDKKVRTIVNFPRMIVESQIDTAVPDPNFKAVAPDDEMPVDALKNYCMYVVRAANPSLEEINLENERRTMKFGISFIKVHWNNAIKRAGFVGDIELSNPHPKDIIPNHGAKSMEDLEHYHHVTNRHVKYFLRKWPHLTQQEIEDKAILYKEFDEMVGTQRINVTDQEPGNKDAGLNKYTLVETTYRDEEGDICKLWWSGDLLIKHIPKFFYRRDEKGNPINSEVLEEDLQVRNGIDPQTGQLQFKTIPKGQQVEYFIPTNWDLIAIPFIPRDKSFWPVSIMEDIHDLNESIKKILFTIEEGYLRGRRKVIVPSEEMRQKITDPFSEVIVSSDPQAVQSVELGPGMDGLQLMETMKGYLQLITGATNAALGLRTPGSTSGRQEQIYVEQSAMKVTLKGAYKANSFKQLYRVIADFAMAFCDDDRAFRLAGDREQEVYGKFNRLDLLKDANGNIVFPDFDIEVTAEPAFMKAKGEVFNNLVLLAGQGRFQSQPGNLMLLKVLNKLGVPFLADIIQEMEDDINQQKQMAQQQMQQQPPQGGGKGPGESINFKDLPPAGKIQLAAQAGIQLQPQDVQGMPVQSGPAQPPGQPQGGAPPPQQGQGPQVDPAIARAIGQNPQLQQALMSMSPQQQAAFLSASPEQQAQILVELQKMVQGGGQHG